jgi:UDP-N-acetylglucosamine 2-epimerase (non-hydrolysing)
VDGMGHTCVMSTGDAAPKPPVLVVIGTRPEAIKMVPLVLALRESEKYVPIVVSTGQHHQMVEDVLGLAAITADVDLLVGDFRTRLNERVSSVMRRFEDFCNMRFGSVGDRSPARADIRSGRLPGLTLVHGDTSSAFAAALASFHLRIPVAHVEAGLRTGGLNLTPFPEELNRQLISCIAAFHLAPTGRNQQNLVREGIPANQIFVTGNTGIDTLHWAAGLDVPFRDPRVAELYESDGPIVIVTAHRRENWGGGLARIGAGVAEVARSHPEARFIVALHPNPAVRAELAPPLEGLDNVLLTDPLRYVAFARLLRRCHFVITDSGGIQEEAPSLDKPVLVARDSTERLEGLEAGTLRLVGTDHDRIVREAGRLLDDPEAYARMAEAINPYGDGHAAERILAAFEHIGNDGPPPTPFGPGYTRYAVIAAAGYELEPGTAQVTPQEEDAEDEAARERVWGP